MQLVVSYTHYYRGYFQALHLVYFTSQKATSPPRWTLHSGVLYGYIYFITHEIVAGLTNLCLDFFPQKYSKITRKKILVLVRHLLILVLLLRIRVVVFLFLCEWFSLSLYYILVFFPKWCYNTWRNVMFSSFLGFKSVFQFSSRMGKFIIILQLHLCFNLLKISLCVIF